MKYVAAIGCAILMAAFGVSQAWAHGGGSMGGITENDLCSMEKGQYFIHFSAYQHATAGAATQFAHIKELKDADLGRYLDATKEEFQSHCRDIPRTGKATLTFDLISTVLRRVPVAVRVVEASERGDSETVLYIPQQVYPSGVVKAETDFAKAGKYRAVVEVEEHAAYGTHAGGAAEVVGHGHDGDGAAAVTEKHASTAEEEAYHAYDSTFSFPFTVGLKTTRSRGGASSSMMSNPAILATAVTGMAVGTVLYVRRKKKVA
ncbi:hypothetical protein [Candidatus Methylomirabilis sp.]|uniref:hypothetical protein n=1 Tax=Candidatus Methylomirabilis sp. TaxID=2032687 RepID=UPI0030764E04